MILQNINPETLGLKTSTALVTVKHDGTVKIGERLLEGPGEYDASGVGVHANEESALFFTEGLRVAVVWQSSGPVAESDEDVDCYIFLHNDSKSVEQLVKEHDPRVVVMHNAELADHIAQADGIAVLSESSYKLTTQTLPTEERIYIRLA